MSLRNNLFFLLVALVLAALLAGCSSSTSPVPTGDNTFNDKFGGLTPTSETPAFGDTELSAMVAGMDADDPMDSTSDVDSLRNMANVNVYSVKFRWGHLQYDSTETAITDWSGTLTLDRGAIIAVRTVGFEEGDHIVRPRESRTVLQWVSRTKQAADGIIVLVYDPNPQAYQTPNTLTFATTPYTHAFAMSDLDSLDELVNVGANQVAITSLKLNHFPCSQGYLDGHWMRSEQNRDTGVFKGLWVSGNGLVFGHYKGRFGVRSDGSRVMYGKWISAGPPDDDVAAGSFKGLLKGTWGYDANVDPILLNHGWFHGDIYDRTMNIIGQYNGTWVAAAPSAGGVDPGNNEHRHKGFGFMSGDWVSQCQQ